MSKKLMAVALIGLLGVSGVADAKTVRLPWAKVVDTLVNDGSTFGGCLARINVNVNTSAPLCPGGAASYVAFSCTGEIQSADAANRIFETAQMAQMLNKEIRFEIDDVKKHNGYCVATRAEIR